MYARSFDYRYWSSITLAKWVLTMKFAFLAISGPFHCRVTILCCWIRWQFSQKAPINLATLWMWAQVQTYNNISSVFGLLKKGKLLQLKQHIFLVFFHKCTFLHLAHSWYEREKHVGCTINHNETTQKQLMQVPLENNAQNWIKGKTSGSEFLWLIIFFMSENN